MSRVVLLVAIVLMLFLPCAAQAPKPVEIAPGVALPTNGDATVYALDQISSGPSLVHIKPHEVYFNPHAGSNFLRAQVFAGPHAISELRGLHSATVLSSTKAVFFVRIGGEDAELMRSRVHVVWLDADKKNRAVAEFSNNIFGGQRKRHIYEVPCTSEMAAGTGWLKVEPKEPLSPGEFAIVFLPADVSQLPDSAFDFSVTGAIQPGVENPYGAKGAAAGSAPQKH